MEASKVYYTDFRCPVGTSLLEKLRRVCIAAGIKDIDMDGRFVAIKMHFGELGNLAFLRPNYAKVVADLCKEQGGMPFLTDCNTLYPGSRKNALEHLSCAQLNGFWPMTTGCQIIIADGLKGNDEVAVPVEGGEYVKEAKIGRALMDADIVVSLTHFKCHENAGIGNQHAVRTQPAQSVDKLRQFGNIAVVHEQVQGQVDFFAVFMNEFNAFLKLFKREF